jgi:hypothetical protein
MTGFKPKRFDIAGAHPDEVYRAVGDIVGAVDEAGRLAGVDVEMQAWRQNRPMRFGDNLDADVQQFVAQGVRFMDGFKEKLPLGLSRGQQDVRDRCHALAGSMEKVLAKRVAAEDPIKAWRYVKVKAAPVTVKQPGQTAWPVEKTVATVKDIARGHFEGSAWKAGIAQRTYALWARNAEEVVEKTGMYPPMPEAARSWDFFMKRVDGERLKSALKGEHWAHVDVNEGIDFSQVINFRATYRPRQNPKVRM